MEPTRLTESIDELVRSGRARAVLLLQRRGEVLHARGDFATQIVVPPGEAALAEGFAHVRSQSGELLVFLPLEGGQVLAGVFDDAWDEVEALRALSEAVRAATTLQ